MSAINTYFGVNEFLDMTVTRKKFYEKLLYFAIRTRVRGNVNKG